MQAGYKNMSKSITIALIYCLISLYIFSGVPGGVVFAQTSASQTTTGVLEISGSKYVLLNENKTPRGTTVLTGAKIETQNNNGAMVNFDRLGRLEIGCRSSVRLTYSQDQIEATVLSGYARLVTNQGVSGTLITPDNQTLKTDPSLPTSTVETATANACGPLVFPTGAAAAGAAGAATAGVATTGGLFGLGAVSTALIFIGAPVAGVAIALAARNGPPCDRLPIQAVSNVRACNP